MTLLFHWIIAYCKTTKRIGTLNFTNMNLPFVVINLLMVCLSIAGHTTQGYTGCHKHVCLLLGLILVASKRSGMLGQREYVALGISMLLLLVLLLLNQSTLTIGAPIGFPPGGRLLMFGVSGVPCGWRKSSKWRGITPGLGSGMLCTIYLALGVPLGNR